MELTPTQILDVPASAEAWTPEDGAFVPRGARSERARNALAGLLLCKKVQVQQL